jgi:hypothetical protein
MYGKSIVGIQPVRFMYLDNSTIFFIEEGGYTKMIGLNQTKTGIIAKYYYGNASEFTLDKWIAAETMSNQNYILGYRVIGSEYTAPVVFLGRYDASMPNGQRIGEYKILQQSEIPIGKRVPEYSSDANYRWAIIPKQTRLMFKRDDSGDRNIPQTENPMVLFSYSAANAFCKSSNNNAFVSETDVTLTVRLHSYYIGKGVFWAEPRIEPYVIFYTTGTPASNGADCLEIGVDTYKVLGNWSDGSGFINLNSRYEDKWVNWRGGFGSVFFVGNAKVEQWGVNGKGPDISNSTNGLSGIIGFRVLIAETPSSTTPAPIPTTQAPVSSPDCSPGTWLPESGCFCPSFWMRSADGQKCIPVPTNRPG